MNKANDFLPAWALVLIDAFFCFCSLTFAYLLRFNFSIPALESQAFIYLFPFLIISRCLGFYITGIYKSAVRYTDSEGKLRIAMIQFMVSIFFAFSHLVFSLSSFSHFIIPYSIIIIIEYFLSTSIFVAVKDNEQWFYNLYHGIEKVLVKGGGFLKKLDGNMDKLIIFFLAITVAPLIFVSFYSHPSADDFGYANMIHYTGGFFAAQKAWYLTWTGRYFAMFLSSLNPLVFHSYIGYKLNTVIIVIMFVLALYWMLGVVFVEMSRFSKWCITSLSVLLYFLYLPDIAEGLFWISGADTAQVPIVFTFLLIGCLVKFLKSEKKIILYILCVAFCCYYRKL